MQLDSSNITKPISSFLLFAVVLFLVVYVLRGHISIEDATIRGSVLLAGVFAWKIGLHNYALSFITHNTTIPTLIFGWLMRFGSSFLYLLLFIGIFFIDENARVFKAQYMIVLSIVSIAFAFLFYRRIRFFEDTAHSSLNSAAQGYAVLKGDVALFEGEVVRGPHQELPPMVWHAKHLHTNSAGFLLNDGKGVCTVDPRDAEVITPRHRYGSYAYYAIYPGETIYLIGQLETLSKQRNEHERKTLVSKQIIQWKRNPLQLLDYFDHNKDGAIDDAEMSNVRNAAEKTVDEELEEIYQQPASHVVSQPVDGRPFIISSIHPTELLSRYKRAMFFHLFSWIVLSIYALAMQVS